ncbi:hypothetical protein GF312_04535 [Candidatus Poribacteria bacterium]|nr:hypothetical protein [Candidatus Poribacteria bacterium]
MAVFERLPERIRKAALEQMSPDEDVKMCFLAGSSMTSKDYVVITSRRVLVMDERTIGTLGKTYVNIKENVPIDQITEVDFFRSKMNKILGQSSMGMQVDQYKYLIRNARNKDIKAAGKLISELAGLGNDD